MPELLQETVQAHDAPQTARDGSGVPPATGGRARVREDARRLARRDLRDQIGALEHELAELFASAFPRRGIDFQVPPAGGPRVLGIRDLERVRDALASRLHQARSELSDRAYVEDRKRELLERMVNDPAEYRWVRVSNEDIGDPGCRHYHSRPRWGILGMILGWWRVKLSSGCP
jgi:hypothetical protein